MPATQTQATEKRGRGRPRKPATEQTTPHGYSLPHDLIASCNTFAKARKVSASSVVAEALANYLRQHQAIDF